MMNCRFSFSRSGLVASVALALSLASSSYAQTPPPAAPTEDTEVRSLCRLMHKLRIHRVPITRDGEVTGIISSLDVCGALARGDAL